MPSTFYQFYHTLDIAELEEIASPYYPAFKEAFVEAYKLRSTRFEELPEETPYAVRAMVNAFHGFEENQDLNWDDMESLVYNIAHSFGYMGDDLSKGTLTWEQDIGEETFPIFDCLRRLQRVYHVCAPADVPFKRSDREHHDIEAAIPGICRTMLETRRTFRKDTENKLVLNYRNKPELTIRVNQNEEGTGYMLMTLKPVNRNGKTYITMSLSWDTGTGKPSLAFGIEDLISHIKLEDRRGTLIVQTG